MGKFVTVVCLVLVVRSGASAQSAVQPALDLYAAAAYDDALAALDALDTTGLTVDERLVADQHRMFCLMALGRVSAAETVAAAVLEAHPDFVLDDHEASPRVRAMLDGTRRRVLPSLVRRLYAAGKQAFDAGHGGEALDRFGHVSRLLDDPRLVASDPSLADLKALSDGFARLAAATLDGPSRPRSTASPVALDAVPADLPSTLEAAAAPEEAATPPPRPASPLVEADASTDPAAEAPGPARDLPSPAADASTTSTQAIDAPPPFTPIDIFTYDWRDKNVVPPVPLSQAISGWWGSRGEPPAGTRLGAIDVVVDEHGRVAEAQIYLSVNRVFDAVLLESVKQWRYTPATRDGRPVRYRRVTGVVSGR